MRISRRQFLHRSAVAGAAALVPGFLDAALAGIARGATADARGFGPLRPDPDGLLDLPAGFRYRALSTAKFGTTHDARFSQTLDNGDPVPALHDGMAAFAGTRGTTILVRNHELDPEDTPVVDPLGLRRYDPLGTGGTTTLWIDAERNVVRAFASLSGTFRNCAGGPTPWGTWLTAEECTYMPGEADAVNADRRPDVTRPHGYVFEVDPRAEGLVEPVPLRAMGRFYHEAVAVDPVTGFVYLTEDHDDGLLFRFRPYVVTRGRKYPAQMRAGDLAKGGVLEALRVPASPQLMTQNRERRTVGRGTFMAFDWVPLDGVEPEMDIEFVASAGDPNRREVKAARGSLRVRGFEKGAAQFARAEGITYHEGAVYVCCTNGGPARAGQVWRLDLRRGALSLAVEAESRDVLDGPDNICPTPWGDLLVCEDGRAEDRVLGLTPEGRVYPLARNAFNRSEMAGACFSPDGRTLFVNMQEPGVTYAIWGPWDERIG